ncbi:hypothetical protein EYC84_010135 [Monilinia fructicola]|uniref:Uncharacterized protein n=1 Tax=Monilinia fructicola TaxID=38448 RepID=A0A5M9JE68_MONFR|nr:hypothetical protein EYC84_010135 [Monilinia fructicola]
MMRMRMGFQMEIKIERSHYIYVRISLPLSACPKTHTKLRITTKKTASHLVTDRQTRNENAISSMEAMHLIGHCCQTFWYKFWKIGNCWTCRITVGLLFFG